MEKSQNQNGTPAVETEQIETPPIQEEKKELVIETEDLTESDFKNHRVVWPEPSETKMQAETLGNRPENDRKLSHEKRVLAFLESRHTGDFIKLNDFLKSLYPAPKGKEKPAWSNQGAMRKLRQDLLSMRDRGEIVFSNNNVDRLGDNYHVGEQRIRQDYNIGDLVIEAKLA